MKRSALSFACAAILASTSASAQGVTHVYHTWFGLFTQGPIVGRLYFQGDFHHRVYDDFSPYWSLVRPGVGVRVAPGMLVTLGYAWTPSWRAAGVSLNERVDEHRVWEQWQYELPLPRIPVKLQLRARLEQRWRPASGDDLGHRLRGMVRATIPLRGRWVLAVWDELFVTFNDTDWGQRAGFDQNRLFVGPGVWALPGTLRVELGYLHQLIRRAAHPNGDLSNHAVALNTYLSWR